MKEKIIVFHGTRDKETANQILKTGFRKGTYFARHLEDSICYGGKYIFWVCLEIDGDNWQIVAKKRIPPSRIVQLANFNPKRLYHNDNARIKFFDQNKNYTPTPCRKCGADIGRVELSILGKPVVARCPKCRRRFN